MYINYHMNVDVCPGRWWQVDRTWSPVHGQHKRWTKGLYNQACCQPWWWRVVGGGVGVRGWPGQTQLQPPACLPDTRLATQLPPPHYIHQPHNGCISQSQHWPAANKASHNNSQHTGSRVVQHSHSHCLRWNTSITDHQCCDFILTRCYHIYVWAK